MRCKIWTAASKILDCFGLGKVKFKGAELINQFEIILIINKRPERPYPALRYSEKGQQVSEGEQSSASDLQKF